MGGVGVIARPTWQKHTVSKLDQFIVLASDGVWDVFTDDQVVELIDKAESKARRMPKLLQSKKDRNKNLAEKLVRHAQKRWELEDPTQVVDDTTALVIFF